MICLYFPVFGADDYDIDCGDWVRGKIVEIHDESCIVLLIDYGRKVTVWRKINTQLFSCADLPDTKDYEIAGLRLMFKSLPELKNEALFRPYTVKLLSGNTENGYLAEFVQAETIETVPNQAHSNVSSKVKSETTTSKVSTVQTIQTGSAPSEVKKERMPDTKQLTEYSTDVSSSIIDINTTQHEEYQYIIITKIKSSTKGKLVGLYSLTLNIYSHFGHSE